MSIVITATGAIDQIANALWVAKAGDVFEFVGTFPAGRGKMQAPAKVTFDFTRAVLDGAQYWQAVDGISIVGGDFRGGLRVDGAKNFSVTGAAFNGGGIFILGGANLAFTGNSFVGGGGCAIGVQKTVGLLSDSNTFTAMAGDCHQFTGCSDVTVRRGRCSGGKPTPTAHPDYLQSTAIAGFAMTNWLIEDNDVSGETQGLFLPGGVIGTARRNRIDASLDNGVSVGSGTVLTIENNTLTGRARFIAYPGGSFIKAGGNTQGGVAFDAPPPAPVPAPQPREITLAPGETLIVHGAPLPAAAA